MDNLIDSEPRPLLPGERMDRISRLVRLSEQVYVEHILNGVLDLLVRVNPSLSAPYLETTNRGNGVYEVNLLIHVSQYTKENTDETEL